VGESKEGERGDSIGSTTFIAKAWHRSLRSHARLWRLADEVTAVHGAVACNSA
jgi:hypothetical protein